MAAEIRGTQLRGVIIGSAVTPPPPASPYSATVNGNSGSMAYFPNYSSDFPGVVGVSSSIAWLDGTPGGVTYPTPPNDQLPGSWLSTYATLSNSNKTVTFDGTANASAISSVGATFSLTPQVVEITIGQVPSTFMVGTFSSGSPQYTGPDNLYGFNPDTYDGNAFLSYFAYYQNNGLIGGTFSASTFTTGDVIAVLVVADTGSLGNLVYFYKNGVLQNPLDPITAFPFATTGFSVGLQV